MGTRIAGILVLIALCVGGYFVWLHYKQAQTEDGAVTCTGCMTPDEKARFDKENSGDTADGNSEHKVRTARAEDAAGNPEGAVAAGQVAPVAVAPGAPAPTAASNAVNSNTNPNTAAATPVATSPTATPTATRTTYPTSYPASQTPTASTYASSGVGGGLPTADSQMANAPNGMRFAGTGSYQWYRQGNLTWRVDTVGGSSCIAFATMEEWRKQIVYSHGCGKGA